MEFGVRLEANIIIGPPGSGKSTLTRHLSQYPGALVLKGNSILPDQSRIHEVNRDLVPDDLFVPRLKDRLALVPVADISLLIVENIPRTPEQARVLVDWLRQHDIPTKTFLLSLTQEQVWQKIMNRQVCSSCNETYYPDVKPSMIDDLCDKDGAVLIKRPGDRGELVAKSYGRYLEVKERVLPILADYGEVHEIDTSRDVVDIWDELKEVTRFLMGGLWRFGIS